MPTTLSQNNIYEVLEDLTEDVQALTLQPKPKNAKLLKPLSPFMNREFQTAQIKCDKAPISVVSYNVLCSKYGKSAYFPYVDKKYLSWRHYRKERLIRELLCYNADIICLQEVDYFRQWWCQEMKKYGYISFYKQRTRGRCDGCAIFVKSEKFEVVEHYDFEYNGLAIVDYKQVNLDLMQDNIGHFVLLRFNKMDYLCVANTHLFWNPEYAHVKLAQAHALLEEAKMFLGEMKKKFSLTKIPLIICGDFNSLPQSEVYNLFTTGEASVQRPKRKNLDKVNEVCTWKLMHLQKKQDQQRELEAFGQGCITDNSTEVRDCEDPNKEIFICRHKLKLQSAYAFHDGKEPDFTNYTEGFKGCLDYIFFSSELKVYRILKMISEEKAKKYKALPSKDYPSDHVALYCEFLY